MLTWIPACTVEAVLFDQVGALAEPPVVFGIMPARLGHILAKCQVHFIADDLLFIDSFIFSDRFMDTWIGIRHRSPGNPDTMPYD